MREAYILFIILLTIVIGLMIYKFFLKKAPAPSPQPPVFTANSVAKKRDSCLVKWTCTGSTGSPDWPNKPRFIRPAGLVDMKNPLTLVNPTSNDDNSIIFDATGGTVFTLILKSMTYFYKTDDTGTSVNITFKQNPKADTPLPITLVTGLTPNALTTVDFKPGFYMTVKSNDSFIPKFDQGTYVDGSFIVLEVVLGGVPPLPPGYLFKPYTPSSNVLNPWEYMTYGQTLTSPDGATTFTLQNGTLKLDILSPSGSSPTSYQIQVNDVAYLLMQQSGQLVLEDINLAYIGGINFPFPLSGNVKNSTLQFSDKTQSFSIMVPKTTIAPSFPIASISNVGT